MRVSIFVGDIADVRADAVCTSTNPRLSLLMGTGAAIREHGGFEVLRACERLIEEETARSGRTTLPIGSAQATTAGQLPFKVVIHCVASDATHHLSSPDIIRACVANALKCAEANGCSSVAMPVFAAGHAHIKFDLALGTMAEALRDSRTTIEHVTVVIYDADRADDAQRVIDSINSSRS